MAEEGIKRTMNQRTLNEDALNGRMTNKHAADQCAANQRTPNGGTLTGRARERLAALRHLRVEEARHRFEADNDLERATRGMSVRAATNRSGTGRCPLTDYALRYARARELADAAGSEAAALWAGLRPTLCALAPKEREALRLAYDRLWPLERVARRLGATEEEARRLLASALHRLEGGEGKHADGEAGTLL